MLPAISPYVDAEAVIRLVLHIPGDRSLRRASIRRTIGQGVLFL